MQIGYYLSFPGIPFRGQEEEKEYIYLDITKRTDMLVVHTSEKLIETH